MITVYYLPVGEKQAADWEEFRQQWNAHIDEARKVCDMIGAKRFHIGLAGRVVAAMFGGGPVHPAFSTKPKRNGAHVILSRGRSTTQKEAIAFMEEQNDRLSKLYPSPTKVGESHGFIGHISYKCSNGNEGWSRVGHFIDCVSPEWAGNGAPIIISTEDIHSRIMEYKRQGEDNPLRYPDMVVSPEYFATPDGYERITKARRDFINAEFRMKHETIDSEGEDDAD